MTLFTLPPGVDFAAELMRGLVERHPDPIELARVRVIVNTRRMERRLTTLFTAGPALLLPRIEVVTAMSLPPGHPPIPPATSGLRRRLDIIELVARLIEADPTLAPRASLYDLADSLIALMDEMQGEGVTADTVAKLDVTDQSGHWARAQRFFGIVAHYLGAATGVDAETRQVRVTDAWLAHWQDHPPVTPVYIAGSTGSRGTTHRLMLAAAQLSGCGLILPGFDHDLPPEGWARLNDPLSGEDHPQFRYARLLRALDLNAGDTQPWTDAAPSDPLRNRLVSLALRPAPVTDQWRRDGPALGDLGNALDNVTLLEASSPREEAQAIALRLRQAAEDGRAAALITPDRMLTRRVAAALDRWGIVPDDSAGTPLHLSPPGRLLRHLAALPTQPVTVETLLTVMKHPLTHSGGDRGAHQRLTRDLELHLRDKEVAYPDPARIRAFAASKDAAAWGEWACDVLFGTDADTRPVEAQTRTLIERAERAAAGPDGDPAELWAGAAGRQAREMLDDLEAEAGADDAPTIPMAPRDFANLVHSLLSRGEVRDRDAPHPHVLIWGTLEARVQGAEVVILGGLNDGTWPQAPRPDPWLNRVLRNRAGLLLPDRQVGLSAHDFQIAVAAPEVWLSRSLKSDDAETVPSRWINRLGNLLTGLDAQGGDAAWKAARARGETWLRQAEMLDAVDPGTPAPRPSPAPPRDVRPRSLNVTDIARLRRDPYAIYARDILRLRPLNPVVRVPDPRLRGILMHRALERFVKGGVITPEALSAAGEVAFAEGAPWASTRAAWQARLDRIAPAFVTAELGRQALAHPVAFEAKARTTIKGVGVELKGRADRIDLTEDGQAFLYDYKTGAPPTPPKQLAFDRQLLIEAAMLTFGAFDAVAATTVIRATYLGLGTDVPEVDAPLGDGDKQETVEEVWAKLATFLEQVLDPGHGFTSRRAVFETRFEGDYDHLARFGEWDHTTPATLQVLT
ncbi:double-strand break repair protein AddB [Pseudaestuariivita atlantica]|uniref:PD-(D/E)XK endonuclease-like domain-containing protein n=1 Tax=Pseudaestuariivita atlantica TaxID=1317121 RepID=A0A0L1JPG8_9RHOB|nr:double-strand break repair protein AddB [Pseudaestuariivita atlantica]KNG93659.1 hypothetical protein ATO11_10705 [Pseudaestuariivita atlantica]